MDKQETEKLFKLLAQFYPQKKPRDEQKYAWYLALQPYRYEDVKYAAVCYAREQKYFPDLSDLTAGLQKKERGSFFPWTEEEEKRMRKYRIFFEEVRKKGLPDIEEAKSMGWTVDKWYEAIKKAGLRRYLE